ncbi:AAA family ATPase [Streptomyces xiamenensis]|uniref:AAA family ATPase n=1 Tax=Streptomyces xiamenensis TaxID=408015 RepID=UPI0035DFA706
MDGRDDAQDVSVNSVSGQVRADTIVQARHVIMNLDPAPPARPRPLPREVRPPLGPFVNRAAELTRLAALLETGRHRDGRVVVVVTGLGGIGKTSLLGHWIHALDRELHSPDGDLYVDLAQHRRDGAVDIGAVLTDLLRSLEGEGAGPPASLPAREKRFRTLTAERRLLLFVDGVLNASEVLPLLPTRGVLVVAARRALPGLALRADLTLTVGPLDGAAGTDLVRTLVGPADTTAPEELLELVRLCAGHPQALFAVSELLADQGGFGETGAEILTRLRDARRRMGELSVSQVFDAAFADFPPAARQAYLLLGVHPGATFTKDLVTRVAGPAAGAGLRELARSHLAGPAKETGWFRLNDLVREHAADRARRELTAADRDRLLRAVVDDYVTLAAAADALVLGDRYRIAPPPGGPSPFSDREAAVGWLDAERSNLLAVQRAAYESGWYEPVWRLSESLWALHHGRLLYADWLEANRLGLEAARWEGRTPAQVRMLNQLARYHHAMADQSADGEEARAHRASARELLSVAEELFGAAGGDGPGGPDGADGADGPGPVPPVLRGVIWETGGLLWVADGQPRRALPLFARALAANEAAGDRHGVAVQTYNLAQAHLAAGDLPAATAALEDALAVVERTGDDPMRSRIGIVLAKAALAADDARTALRHATTAAQWAARLGQHPKLDQALTLVIGAAERLGDTALRTAAQARRSALRQDG